MISMKMDKEEAKEQTQPMATDAPEYPYGLELRLDDGSLTKLGMTEPPAVGTKFTLTAQVTVTSASAYQTQGSEAESSSCWQITDMEVAKKPGKSAAKTLYPED